ncbi:MAG: cytochrome c family protein [Planctomycetota bacterium]
MEGLIKKIMLVGVILLLMYTFKLGGDNDNVKEEKKEEKPPKESPFREPEHQYVGVKKCKICHRMKKLAGEEFQIWEQSKHAKAYETLGTDEAKKIAKEKGIENPQEDGKCLKCHIIAYGVDEKWRGDEVTKEEGVSCEACHGPGGDYKDKETMKNREKAIEKGLVIPNEKTCLACHNSESPSYKEFKYEEFREKIKHWEEK